MTDIRLDDKRYNQNVIWYASVVSMVRDKNSYHVRFLAILIVKTEKILNLIFTFACNAKSFAIAILFVLLFLFLNADFGRTGKVVRKFFFSCCFKHV